MLIDVHHRSDNNDHTHHHLPDNVTNELLFTGGIWSYITGSGVFTTDPDPSDREWIGIGSPTLYYHYVPAITPDSPLPLTIVMSGTMHCGRE